MPNQGRVVQAAGSRILCIADVRGRAYNLKTGQTNIDGSKATSDLSTSSLATQEQTTSSTLETLVSTMTAP